jgi:hypothetical protein
MGAWGLRQGVALGVHDDLYARALVVDDGSTTIGIVALDFAGITKGILDAVRSRVEQLTGIPAKRLLVNSTHNHTTPAFLGEVPPALASYAGYVTDVIAGAVAEAAHRLEPARAGHGSGDLSGATVNRQYRERSIDTTVGVLRVDSRSDEPIARVVNWPCHNLCVGGQYRLWSADFTGVACRMLDRRFGGAVAIFLQGAGGDIHPFDWWFGNAKSKHLHTFADAEALGAKLAREAARRFDKVPTSATVKIGAVGSVVSMPRHRVGWTVDEAERLHRALVKRLGTYRGDTWPEGTTTAIAGERHPELYGNGSNEVRLARNQDGPPIPAEIQAFRIGDLTIMCNPGELFNELGSAIKEGVGGDAWVASYCNDYVGYVSTREPYDDIVSVPLDEIVDMKRYRRYYGTTTSPFDAGAGEKLVAAEVRLAKRLS